MSPKRSPQKLGLLGGTFDPIHNGHIALATAACQFIGLPSVLLIPAAIPPHKDLSDISPPQMRLRLTQAAAKDDPTLLVSDIELNRTGVSYTVDTLTELKEQYGFDTELYLIVGLDNLTEIRHWYRPEEIAELSTLVVGGRPGYEAQEPVGILAGALFMDEPRVDLSSTTIRDALRNGADPFSLDIPAAVAEIIHLEKMYRE